VLAVLDELIALHGAPAAAVLAGGTRFARAMVCISVWFRIGLSRYTVEQLGASKPVSHMAQMKTRRNGSSGVLEPLVKRRL